MCFYLKKSDKGKEPKIAKKDIIVYKVITKSGLGFIYDLKIDGKDEQWTPGYIYSESDPFDTDYFYNVIHGRCFHSSKTFSDVRYYMNYCNCKIVKMIIPKGSLYYENDTEYVSDTIYYPLQDEEMNLL